MNLDIITDQDGKDHLIFDSSELYDDSNCGSSSLDYEILRSLGTGSFGSVAKVRSKRNQKIYAMKKVDLNKIEDDALRLSKNEIKYLQGLRNRHVIKYYKHFEENGILYIIIEFMNNGDVSKFMEAHQKLNIHIKEEMLWNIFLQSMTALSYVHSKGIIHRDIKPGNLMMDNNLIIKLGDFGVSALLDKNPYENLNKKNQKQTFIFKKNEEMLCNGTICGTPAYMAKEMLPTDDDEDKMYDQKIDVYSMGCTFYELCYFHPYKEKDPNSYDNLQFIRVVKPGDKNVNYSNELLKIINLMLEEDSNKRPTSSEILELIQKGYTTKYVKNSSIESVIRCLSAFPNLTSNFFALDIYQQNKPICYKYKNCLASINNQNQNWNSCINEFRQLLGTENSKLEGSKEIEPRVMLGFLLDRIHRELNNVNNMQNNNCHLIITNTEEVKTNWSEMFIKFNSDFQKSFNSIISNNFLGFVKIENTCQSCKLTTFNYKNFCFVTFDFEKINLAPGQNFSIPDGLLNQNSMAQSTELFCGKCLDKKEHQVFKKYFIMPMCLIISFKRGAKCQIKTKIQVQDVLNLNNVAEFNNSPKNYKLIGIISRVGDCGNEHYSSFIIKNGQWVSFSGENTFGVSPMAALTNENGDIVMLFYQAC